ncbi:hypothetical protein AB0F18_10000 [Streptomyces sp. NPDC029216]
MTSGRPGMATAAGRHAVATGVAMIAHDAETDLLRSGRGPLRGLAGAQP